MFLNILLERVLSFQDEPVADSYGVSIVDVPFSRDDLNKEPSDYDKFDLLVATVDQEMAHKFWYSWGATALISAVWTMLVFMAIILSKETRQNSFNVYLIMLMIPDLYYNGGCAIQCLWNAQLGHVKSVAFCQWQSHMVIFGITANAWMNGLVAHQIHKMLVCTKSCRQYHPPSCKTVIKYSLIVYLYALVWSFLPLIPKIPFKTGVILGVGCIPTQYDGLSLLFLYCIWVPMAVGIPLSYVLWAAYGIWRKDLIPRDIGRAKHLLIYFARIVLVFIVCWFPSTVMLPMFHVRPLVRLAFSNLGHVQGGIAATASLLKPDVWEAFKRLFGCFACFCCCCRSSCFSPHQSSQNKDNVEATDRDESMHWGCGEMTTAAFGSQSLVACKSTIHGNVGIHQPTKDRASAHGDVENCP
eukprot:scaffold4420_cov187-Amphora_coffeaeformis.AAC.2